MFRNVILEGQERVIDKQAYKYGDLRGFAKSQFPPFVLFLAAPRDVRM
jgi:hypothetical protein